MEPDVSGVGTSTGSRKSCGIMWIVVQFDFCGASQTTRSESCSDFANMDCVSAWLVTVLMESFRTRTNITVDKINTSFRNSKQWLVTTFCVRHSRGEMYIGHMRLCLSCVSVCLSLICRIPTLLHEPRCNLGEW